MRGPASVAFEGVAEQFCRGAVQMEKAGRCLGKLNVEATVIWAVGLMS